MPRLKSSLTAAAAALCLALTACGGGSAVETASSSAAVATQTATSSSAAPPAGAGPGGGVDVSSVSSVDELVSLIQAAYGEPSLGLHRGHQDVENTLIEVLGITHDEMHVRMDAGQNLAAIADELGVDRPKLIDALVEAGTITQAQADAYADQLVEAYTFRVTWDGEAATPTAETV
jgi:hypothetical protein